MTTARSSASRATIVGIALASVLVPLNSTMIAVALPALAREFGIAKAHAGVLITVYLVAMLVGQPLAGRVGDAIGVRRLATIAVVGFGACSAASMFAASFALLVTFRVAQAVFACAITPSVQAMLRMITVPDERGRAFGLQGSVVGVGAGLGPVIGGLLLSLFGWRAIFAVNIPIVAVVLVVLRRSVPASPGVDVLPGDAAVGDLTEIPATPGGRQRMANAVFVAAFGTQALSSLAQYALLLVTPLLLDDRGWASAAIGLALSLLTLGMIVMSPAGGRFGDAHGRRLPVMIGLSVATIAVAVPAIAGDDTASAVVLLSLLLFGLGLGGATPSILTAGIEAAPDHRVGLASGLLSASRYVGSIVASVMLTTIVDDSGRGVGTMFAICVVALLASLATARTLPGPAASSGVADAVSAARGPKG